MNAGRKCLKCSVPWDSILYGYKCAGSIFRHNFSRIEEWNEEHDLGPAEPPAEAEWRKEPLRSAQTEPAQPCEHGFDRSLIDQHGTPLCPQCPGQNDQKAG